VNFLNILFLTIAFPERIEDRNLYTDLMQEFKENGHSVYVATSRERKYRKKTTLSIENGINVLRIKTGNLQKINIIEKGISTLLIENQFIYAVKKYIKEVKFDLIIYSTPPITFERVIKYVKNKDNCKTYLLLKDIFPQNAVDIGILNKNGFIYKYFRNKEKCLYKISDYIGCMSEANHKYILKNNEFINSDKVEVCPNSIKPINLLKNNEKKRQIRDKYGINADTTVFIYGGNLGKPQGIHFLIEVLASNRKRNDIFFLIVGNGTEHNKLEKCISDFKVNNIKLYSALPKDEFDNLLQACDVGMIFLDERFTIPNFPSRLLSYMEFAMPVIAATDLNTDIGDVIVNGEFGMWSKSGDIGAFNNNINNMCSNIKLEEMGHNARGYLTDNYTVSTSYEIIVKHFK
jgi:glycosyltransferase involved in cell wall biosynthesis